MHIILYRCQLAVEKKMIPHQISECKNDMYTEIDFMEYELLNLPCSYRLNILQSKVISKINILQSKYFKLDILSLLARNIPGNRYQMSSTLSFISTIEMVLTIA